MRNFESGKDYLSFLLRDTVNLNTERGITMADGDRFDQSSRFPAVPFKRKWSCPTRANRDDFAHPADLLAPSRGCRSDQESPDNAKSYEKNSRHQRLLFKGNFR